MHEATKPAMGRALFRYAVQSSVPSPTQNARPAGLLPLWEIWLADLKPDEYADPAEGWETLNNNRQVELAYQAFKRNPRHSVFRYKEGSKNYYIGFDKMASDDGTRYPEINRVPCQIAQRCFKNGDKVGYRSIRRRVIPDSRAQ